MAGKTSVECQPKYVALSDSNEKTKFVYSYPQVQSFDNKVTPVYFDFDKETSLPFVPLPNVSFPLVLSFGVSAKPPRTSGAIDISKFDQPFKVYTRITSILTFHTPLIASRK